MLKKLKMDLEHSIPDLEDQWIQIDQSMSIKMEKMEPSEDKMTDAETVKREDTWLRIVEPLNDATIVVRLDILAKNVQHPRRKECLSAIKIKKKTKRGKTTRQN